MVSMFIQANRQVLSQIQCEGKGQAIAAIMQLLALVDIEGAVVTIDAMGCQKAIAEKIVEGKGDYVLAVMDNQKALHTALERELNAMILDGFKGVVHDEFHTQEEGHSHREIRCVSSTNQIDWPPMRDQWAGIQSVAVVETVREMLGTQEPDIQTFRRYYISSLPQCDAVLTGDHIRGHRGVENNLHWQLDITSGRPEPPAQGLRGAEYGPVTAG
jgi:predicted transposase YbfD/YdcC